MDNKYLIIIAVVILIYFICKKNIENFDPQYKKQRCNVQTVTGEQVDQYASNVCVIDDNVNSRTANNNRLNCREFESKQIFLSLDKEGYCDGEQQQQTVTQVQQQTTPLATQVSQQVDQQLQQRSQVNDQLTAYVNNQQFIQRNPFVGAQLDYQQQIIGFPQEYMDFDNKLSG